LGRLAWLEKNHALVLGGDGIPERRIPPTTWAFVLEPSGEKTRFFGALAFPDAPHVV